MLEINRITHTQTASTVPSEPVKIEGKKNPQPIKMVSNNSENSNNQEYIPQQSESHVKPNVRLDADQVVAACVVGTTTAALGTYIGAGIGSIFPGVGTVVGGVVGGVVGFAAGAFGMGKTFEHQNRSQYIQYYNK